MAALLEWMEPAGLSFGMQIMFFAGLALSLVSGILFLFTPSGSRGAGRLAVVFLVGVAAYALPLVQVLIMAAEGLPELLEGTGGRQDTGGIALVTEKTGGNGKLAYAIRTTTHTIRPGTPVGTVLRALGTPKGRLDVAHEVALQYAGFTIVSEYGGVVTRIEPTDARVVDREQSLLARALMPALSAFARVSTDGSPGPNPEG